MGRLFLILIDADSKWMEVHILSLTNSASTMQCLRRIFATFGIPEVLVSDTGPNFSSAEFGAFLRRNGNQHKLSAPYHPASNGLVERAVQTFKRTTNTANSKYASRNSIEIELVLDGRPTSMEVDTGASVWSTSLP